MTSPFTARTLSFLRALKRNNDREWFKSRKAEYEQHVRGPMIELLDRLAGDLPKIAPDLVSEPKVSLYRIYRDTRFSADKTPLKTHVAAHFPSRRFSRGEGAGLYLEVAPKWVWIGGGLYMPSSTELQAIRRHIAATHPRLHRLATGRRFTTVVGDLDGERLTRVPRGYVKDHPAAHYLRYRQFLAGCEYEAAFATSRRFYPELLKVFTAAAPLIEFLNDALVGPAEAGPHVRPAEAGRHVPVTQTPSVSDDVLPPGRARSVARPQVPAPMW